MASNVVSDEYKSSRSSVLYTITGLVVAVFIIFGLAISAVFISSQESLIDKSKDKIIQAEVDNINSAIEYVVSLLMPVFNQKAQEISVQEMLEALTTGKLSEPQLWMNNEMAVMIKQDVMGLEKAVAIMTSSPLTGGRPVILAANEEALLTWEVPQYILDALDEDQPYLLMEEGIPELGLEGEQLLVFKKTEDASRGIEAYFIGVTSLQEKVDEINAFYDEERNRTILYISIVLVISILLIVIITYFVLSYLLRKRITEPINELSAAAEEVLEGNLDVEVSIRKGEELEKLKTVFNEMLKSLREVINMSVGEEE